MRTFFVIQILALIASMACNESAFGQVIVTLKESEVVTSSPRVLIRDIATISGGPSETAGRIGDLDIDSFDAGTETSSITQEQVAIRVAIAGINNRSYMVRGASLVQTRFAAKRQINQRLELRLANELAKHYSIPAERIEVTLKPDTRLSSSISTVDCKLASTMPVELPLGTAKLPLRSYSDSNSLTTHSIAVTIAIHRDMTVATGDISKGHVMTADDVTVVRRPVTTRRASFLTLEQTIGKTARMNIASYSLIKPTDVQSISRNQKLVKRNSIVNAVFDHGNLKVTLRGVRATSAGNKGDSIKFVNPNNGAVLNGVVVDDRTLKVY